MATVVFIGSQADVKQVSSFTISTYDVTTTYILTIGAGNLTHVVSTIGTTDADGTAVALAAAWNVSTHPYAKYITATSATDTVTLTADTKGVPFTVVSSDTGGIGVIDSEVVVTANVSKSDINDAANYAGGALPSGGDEIIHTRGAPAMAWNLEAFAAFVDCELEHPRGAGNIGLDRMGFAISADGQTVDASAREYRPHYFKCGFDAIDIGEEAGPSSIAAATRIKIWNPQTGASQTNILSVAGVSIDAGLPTCRMLANSVNAVFDVASASGGFGIAVDQISEVSLINLVNVDDPTNAANVIIGDGVTATTFSQTGGTSRVDTAFALSTLKVFGGTVLWRAKGDLTTLTVGSGAVFDYIGIGSITTVNHDGGTIDAHLNNHTRTITNYNPKPGAVLKGVPNLVITNHNNPTDELYTVTYT